jgi:geranylgeranyl pyrophosphate synthase
MFDAHRLDQTRAEYERRIYGKTASLFAGSTEMGAVLGGAPEAAIAALRGYGSDLGMAFQVVDDVLDLREGTNQLGKPAGQDLRQGTVTLPTMLYASGLDGNDGYRRALEAVIAGDETDPAAIDHLIADIRSSGALEQAMAAAEAYANSAKERAAVVPDRETRELLEEVADFAIGRLS